ncbi:head GIN domain-containing protein [Pedobacter insulae]|uniref:Putative auto-transporter adhesin, head GIN domain n=1 Tax=Pedobacter insulae TaxID=414048 RepID=A0A1I2TSQ8_9SPHI|nr:head GIN domain-containing protein [Pedobacter insulae]SFG67229.1 Putative auto-transporter adhesin, head GIN domain [Pedobacter insulae]
MNFKKIFRTGLALIVIASTTYAVAYAQDSKTVAIKNFNGISVSSGIDLYLTQGSTENLTIKGRNDVIQNVVVEQNGSEVIIKYKSRMNWSSVFKNQSIKVYVNYKNLKRLAASGGSDVYTQNTLKTDLLNLTASGGSDLKLALICKDLSLTISGGSDAELKGGAENLKVTASGGSDVAAFGFPVNYAKATVSGGSDANLFVNKILEAGASGGSDVNYKGNASLKKTSNSKSGDINHIK